MYCALGGVNKPSFYGPMGHFLRVPTPTRMRARQLNEGLDTTICKRPDQTLAVLRAKDPSRGLKSTRALRRSHFPALLTSRRVYLPVNLPMKNRHTCTAFDVCFERYNFPSIVAAQNSAGEFVVKGMTRLIPAEGT